MDGYNHEMTEKTAYRICHWGRITCFTRIKPVQTARVDARLRGLLASNVCIFTSCQLRHFQLRQ